jgi:O-antigen/teichoic acid export membrane protein
MPEEKASGRRGDLEQVMVPEPAGAEEAGLPPTEADLALGGRMARLARGVLRGQGTVFAFAQTLTTQVLVLALNLITGVLTARLLGAEGRGEFAAFSIWPPFVAALVSSGLSAALVHQIKSRPSDERSSVLGSVTILGLLLGTISAAATLILMPLFLKERYAEAVATLAPLAAFISALCLLTVVIRSTATAFGRFRSFNIASWADPALYCTTLITAACLAPLTAERAVLCLWFATAACFVGLAIYFFTLGPVRLRNATRYLPPLTSYMARAAGGNIVGTLVGHMDRLILLVLLPAREFGLYIVAYSLSRLLGIVHTTVSAVMLPAMMEQEGEAVGVLHNRVFRLVLCLVGVAALVAWSLGPFALSLLYGAEFRAAQPIFMILVLEAALGCLTSVTAQLYLAKGRPGFTSLAQLVSFAVICVGLLTLVPLLGAPGAALTMLLSTSLQLSMFLFAMPRALQLARPGLSSFRAELSGYARSLARL